MEKNSVIVAFLLYTAFIGFTGFQWGYLEAKHDFSRPTKYRCHEDVVYQDVGGYWSNTKQSCKKLEEIK